MMEAVISMIPEALPSAHPELAIAHRNRWRSTSGSPPIQRLGRERGNPPAISTANGTTADLRPPLRQYFCGRAAHLRYEVRSDAAALFAQCQPPTRLAAYYTLPGEWSGRRDAVLHFGNPRLRWSSMPGKQMGP